MGIDHERLTYRFQGRGFRLTDLHGHVVKELPVSAGTPLARNSKYRANGLAGHRLTKRLR